MKDNGNTLTIVLEIDLDEANAPAQLSKEEKQRIIKGLASMYYMRIVYTGTTGSAVLLRKMRRETEEHNG